jgi:hypothetical protein
MDPDGRNPDEMDRDEMYTDGDDVHHHDVMVMECIAMRWWY